MAITGYKFTMPLRVRWAEVDRQGVVFNGHYLTYFDVGITDFGKGSGHPAMPNFGDCFAYAAKAKREPLLFKGHEFPYTDVTLPDLATSWNRTGGPLTNGRH